MSRGLLFACALFLSGCPTGKHHSDSSSVAEETCKKTGAQCWYAEGKLGVCVRRDDACTGNDCLVCQSQH